MVSGSSSSSVGLNESPRPKAGKFLTESGKRVAVEASMKVPARRRGNLCCEGDKALLLLGLNESPRPKAGK